MLRATLFAIYIVICTQFPVFGQSDAPIVNLVTNHTESSAPTIAVPERVIVAPPVAGPFSSTPIMFEPMPLGMDPMLDGSRYEIVQGDRFGEYIAQPKYDMPTVKFTLDGFFFSRVGGVQDEPLLMTAPFPATSEGLSSSELNFESKMAGRAELLFFGNKQELAPRASILWTGTEVSKGSTTGSGGGNADINFFNAFAADPAEAYNARIESEFLYADIGLRKTISPAYGISLSLAAGKLGEDLDLTEQDDSNADAGNSTGGGGQAEQKVGFYSQTKNKFYGLELGMDGQLWTNGYLKLDGRATAGIFYNDVQIGAQALNAQQSWDPDNTAFVGTVNLAMVIPADPFNFRVGYQGVYMDGMALPVSQSRERSLFTNVSDNPTDSVWYHGWLLGIEIQR